MDEMIRAESEERLLVVLDVEMKWYTETGFIVCLSS